MKKTSIIFAILLLISFFPYGILSSQASQEFSIDELASEGYSAFVIQGVESGKIFSLAVKFFQEMGPEVYVILTGMIRKGSHKVAHLFRIQSYQRNIFAQNDLFGGNKAWA